MYLRLEYHRELLLLGTRPPPRYPLFPYTTLFRSHRVLGPRAGEAAQGGVAAGVHRRRPRLAQLDRKSTRLNSSHGYISYAVFCLKKKNHRRGVFDARLVVPIRGHAPSHVVALARL